MGRSYREELSELSATQLAVPLRVLTTLREQAARASDRGLIVVASGGTKVVADWACHLQRAVFGCSAVAMTPLEYASLSAPVRAATWFVSAGGRHPDIRHAAKVAQARGDASSVGLIAHLESPLGAWLKHEMRSDVIEFDLPTVGDGFLATTSVWAMACILARAYAGWISLTSPIDSTLCEELLLWGAQTAHEMAELLKPNHDSVLLHDAWTALGAHDLETRFVETALGNYWSSDFRNFGHGRHFWVADRGSRTQVFAIWTPASDGLAEPTIDLLPPTTSVHRVRTPFEGIAGALAALSWSIHLTAEQAERIGRDPGRPGVPQFGEQLYEGRFPYPERIQLDPVQWAISKKTSAVQPGSTYAADWERAYWRARERFETAEISAIVADYDGTLVDNAKRYDPLSFVIVDELVRLLDAGVFFGIATGRGDSVQEKLRDALPKSLWSQLIIGYHNGSAVLRLDENLPDLDGEPNTPPLAQACEVLRRELEANGLAQLRCRQNQMTIAPVHGLPLMDAWRATRELLDQRGFGSLSVWLSSHSIDVLGPRCSKVKVVDRVAELAGCSSDSVLRIGDRGARPGNDWELLAAPLGFSVGDCSAEMDACWNLLPPNLHGAEGTAYLLRQVRTRTSKTVEPAFGSNAR